MYTLRYNSQETRYGESPSYPAGMDSEMYKSMAARRWNSGASLTSDSSLYNNAGAGLANLNSLASLPQNLTGAESQALLQALQQKYQVSQHPDHSLEVAASQSTDEMLEEWDYSCRLLTQV